MPLMIVNLQSFHAGIIILNNITSNPELLLATDFVCHTNHNIFLTGKAGTGKTTFLQQLKSNINKRLIITAPTGVAAINAGGMTLHSFFQIPFGPFFPVLKHRISSVDSALIKTRSILLKPWIY